MNREELEQIHGQVWDTDQLRTDFMVHSFLAPFVMVTRKADTTPGILEFQHHPRFYYAFTENS